MNQNKQGEQQWNRHVWSAAMPSAPMREMDAAANEREIDAAVRSANRQNNTVVGAQPFDGDRIAWQAFLADYSRRTGGRAYVGSRYGGGVTQEIAMQNAARIDKYRRAAHLRYLAAGGTMGYNDYLRESGQHASQGGY